MQYHLVEWQSLFDDKLRELEGPTAFMMGGNVDINKFNNDMTLQVVIQRLENLLPQDDISNLLPHGDFDVEAYKTKLANYIKAVRTPGLRMLLETIFSGATYERFVTNPAGMRMHHAYLGGLLQHSVDVTGLAVALAEQIEGVDKDLVIAGALLHDIGKVPDDEPELPHAIIGMKLAEKYKEKPEVCNAIGAHHDEIEMSSLIAPIIQVCDAISGARPGARREVVESYIKRLKEMEDIALSYPGVVKTYTIQAGRELRVIVGAEKLSDMESESLSHDIAKKIQDEMTYPGQVKITVIRETRAVSYAK